MLDLFNHAFLFFFTVCTLEVRGNVGVPLLLWREPPTLLGQKRCLHLVSYLHSIYKRESGTQRFSSVVCGVDTTLVVVTFSLGLREATEELAVLECIGGVSLPHVG